MGQHPAFWDDLACDLADPEFLEAYVVISQEIAAHNARRNTDAPGPSGPDSI